MSPERPVEAVAEGRRRLQAGEPKRDVAAYLRGEGATLEEIGRVLGLTRERARQLLLPRAESKADAMAREWERIKPLMDAGLTSAAIGAAVGLRSATVSLRIRRRGYRCIVRYCEGGPVVSYEVR